MRRYVDTFLRYWIIVLIPVVLLPAAVFALVGKTSRTYAVLTTVDAVTSTSSPFMYSDPYLSPAQNEANYLTERSNSSSFIDRVVTRATTRSGISTAAIVSAVLSIQAVPGLKTTVTISDSTNNPSAGIRAIQAFLAVAAGSAQKASQTSNANAISVARAAVVNARAQLATASNNLTAYERHQGIAPANAASQSTGDPTLGNLLRAVSDAQTQAQTTQVTLSTALAAQTSLKSATDLEMFRNIDPIGAYPQSHRKTVIKNVAIALLLGLLLGGAFLVLKTALDRSLRYADEVPELLGLPVLVTIPYSTGAHTREKRLRVAGEA